MKDYFNQFKLLIPIIVVIIILISIFVILLFVAIKKKKIIPIIKNSVFIILFSIILYFFSYITAKFYIYKVLLEQKTIAYISISNEDNVHFVFRYTPKNKKHRFFLHLRGQRWHIEGIFIEFDNWLKILGFHSIFVPTQILTTNFDNSSIIQHYSFHNKFNQFFLKLYQNRKNKNAFFIKNMFGVSLWDFIHPKSAQQQYQIVLNSNSVSLVPLS